MKYIFLCCFFLCSFTVFSKEKKVSQDTITQQSEKRIKKGFNLGALPALSFDSDLGFQYGILANIYDFGDGSRYPEYDHSVFLEYSRYTKGSQIARISYDSDRLIKGVRTNFDVAYQYDMLAYFFGFNGYNAVYNKPVEEHNRAFYRYDSRTWRVKADFQDNFGNTPWGWVAGLNIFYFSPNSVDIDKINSDKTNSVSELPDEPGLYDKYIEWGIITKEETERNWLNYLKIGAKYDTRDNRSDPSKGIFSEVLFQTAPSFMFNDFSHTKVALIHRQYLPIIKKRLLLAYRLTYQTTLGNSKVPFYAQPLLINSFETGAASQGLGGKRSLRGIMRNRVVGDGFLMGNFEFRLKILNFVLFKQFFDCGMNFFVDTGYITKEIDVSDAINKSIQDGIMTEQERDTHFNNDKQKFHTSGGAGLKVIMNDNFVMSLDFATPFDKRDGSGIRMYTSINYMF